MRIFDYILGGVKLLFRKNLRICFPVRIDTYTTFECPNFIGRHTILQNCSIGKYSYLGNDCEFCYTSIGRFSSISSDVKLVKGQHPTNTFVSTSPVFFQHLTCFGKGFVEKTIFKLNKTTNNGLLLEVGNDVWIGSHVRLMEGIHISDGAIIGAGSVVTKDIPPYAIAVGVPAKVIRYRFTEEEIEQLLTKKWWESDVEEIKSMVERYHDIKSFIE